MRHPLSLFFSLFVVYITCSVKQNRLQEGIQLMCLIFGWREGMLIHFLDNTLGHSLRRLEWKQRLILGFTIRQKPFFVHSSPTIGSKWLFIMKCQAILLPNVPENHCCQMVTGLAFTRQGLWRNLIFLQLTVEMKYINCFPLQHLINQNWRFRCISLVNFSGNPLMK